MADNLNSHYFHAEAHALTGHLVLPFKEEIKKQAYVKLEGTLADLSDEERAQHNYFSQHAKNFRLEGIISYAAAHTQVSGHASEKHKGASVTLATSVVEDLNVLNVVTADRVVAQISTTHYPGEYAPEVTFLGTHFENLRIARHSAEPYLRLDLVGARPGGKDAMHLDHGTGFIKAIEAQYQRLKSRLEKFGEDGRKKMRLGASDDSISKKYHGGAPDYGAIQLEAAAARDEDRKTGKGKCDGITCSLVENVEIMNIDAKAADGTPAPIKPPARSFGHVIHIPDFGNVFLAELTVNHNSFHLTMIRLELGCIASGQSGFGTAVVNGGSKGGGG
ncbi:MAG: hypothetical protein WAL05_21285 [Candidatus Sulfotelmatobacter sp.]